MDWAFWSDYTLRNVVTGSAVLGVTAGTLGCFAYLRRQSLMGDAQAHAALPGIALAFLLTGSKQPLALMAGAAATGWLGMAAVLAAVRRAGTDLGTAIGVVLTSAFGLGVVLLSVIQKRPDANQAGLDKFLLGQAAALTHESVWTMAALGLPAVAVAVILRHELGMAIFDPLFAATQGRDPHRLGTLLTALVVVAVVIGLNTVGVILMSAMLVAPAAAARQWTQSLGGMVALSGAIGAACGIAGAWLSTTQADLPTGPTIVLLLASVAAISLFFGRARGLAWEKRR